MWERLDCRHCIRWLILDGLKKLGQLETLRKPQNANLILARGSHPLGLVGHGPALAYIVITKNIPQQPDQPTHCEKYMITIVGKKSETPFL